MRSSYVASIPQIDIWAAMSSRSRCSTLLALFSAGSLCLALIPSTTIFFHRANDTPLSTGRPDWQPHSTRAKHECTTLSTPESLRVVRLNLCTTKLSAASPSSRDDGSLAATEAAPEKRSKLVLEFDSMMDEFSQYSRRDIASVEIPRYRVLYEGVAAGARVPEVMRAFEVLFEDLPPLRVGGRMIFRHLKDVMERSIERRKQQEENIQGTTGLTLDQIDSGRAAFMAIDADGSGELSMEELVNAGIVETVLELVGYDSFEEFMGRMDHNEKGLLNFEWFMIGLQKCASDSKDAGCNIETVLTEIQNRMVAVDAYNKMTTKEQRKQKYNKRYDGMLESFAEWEDLVPSGDGRLVDVLRGCFAGAKNREVVEALRIVYTDYAALRIAGDLIFKLMRKLVRPKR